jgi:hypothetical protein
MKKLRLRIDDLALDSFGLSEPEPFGGTVNAREGTDMTCDFCAETETCTQNPYLTTCVSYAAQCPLTENNGWTCGGSGCTEWNQYTCSFDCH